MSVIRTLRCHIELVLRRNPVGDLGLISVGDPGWRSWQLSFSVPVRQLVKYGEYFLYIVNRAVRGVDDHGIIGLVNQGANRLFVRCPGPT